MARALAAAALLAVLSGCSCGGDESLTTYFTDVRFTPDGRALVLEANDGLYVAAPADEPPRRLNELHCETSAWRALDCVRVAPDGERIAALLAPQQVGGAQLWELHLWPVRGEGGGLVAGGVLDAAFSPDGGELIWVQPGALAGTAAIWRLGPGAVAEELVSSFVLEVDDPARALGGVVVSSVGVGYPRQGNDGLELWFRGFDGRYSDLGRPPKGCAGIRLASCVTVAPDGVSLVWQDEKSGVFHLYRAHQGVDLPLGFGYALGFNDAGTFALRMDYAPAAAYLQRVETGALVRGVEAVSGELSHDGELLAYLQVESKPLGTVRLFVGLSRREDRDHDYGIFGTPPVRPLFGASMSLGGVDHAFSGDGRYVFVAARSESEAASQSAALVAVDANTSERRELGEIGCSGCCQVLPAGAALVCLPELDGAVSAPVAVDLYDPVTGLKTRASEGAVDVQPFYDGGGVGVLEYLGNLPELKLVSKDGRAASLGTAVRFALSPTAPQLAVIGALGGVEVRPLP
jgi:hypothetical protein